MFIMDKQDRSGLVCRAAASSNKAHEAELIALLMSEPDWNSFTRPDTINAFKNSLLSSETFVFESQSKICGYLRALVDGFGIYVSELYIAPSCRKNGYGKQLLRKIKQQHPDQDVYVFSDEDLYYEKLGFKRVGSIFRL